MCKGLLHRHLLTAQLVGTQDDIKGYVAGRTAGANRNAQLDPNPDNSITREKL
jgi:hypothetical protein